MGLQWEGSLGFRVQGLGVTETIWRFENNEGVPFWDFSFYHHQIFVGIERGRLFLETHVSRLEIEGSSRLRLEPSFEVNRARFRD